MSWLGQNLGHPSNLQILEEKATSHLDELINQHNELNDCKHMIRKKLEAMKVIKEGERITPSFFLQMKTMDKQEEIFALLDKNDPAMETRIP